jgi:hypothetical protein
VNTSNNIAKVSSFFFNSPESLQGALTKGLSEADIVISSGGVSMGEKVYYGIHLIGKWKVETKQMGNGHNENYTCTFFKIKTGFYFVILTNSLSFCSFVTKPSPFVLLLVIYNRIFSNQFFKTDLGLLFILVEYS